MAPGFSGGIYTLSDDFKSVSHFLPHVDLSFVKVESEGDPNAWNTNPARAIYNDRYFYILDSKGSLNYSFSTDKPVQFFRFARQMKSNRLVGVTVAENNLSIIDLSGTSPKVLHSINFKNAINFETLEIARYYGADHLSISFEGVDKEGWKTYKLDLIENTVKGSDSNDTTNDTTTVESLKQLPDQNTIETINDHLKIVGTKPLDTSRGMRFAGMNHDKAYLLDTKNNSKLNLGHYNTNESKAQFFVQTLPATRTQRGLTAIAIGNRIRVVDTENGNLVSLMKTANKMAGFLGEISIQSMHLVNSPRGPLVIVADQTGLSAIDVSTFEATTVKHSRAPLDGTDRIIQDAKEIMETGNGLQAGDIFMNATEDTRQGLTRLQIIFRNGQFIFPK